MSAPRRTINPIYYGIVFALVALVGFLVLGGLALLVLIPVIVYLLWDLNNRVTRLEKRFPEPEKQPSESPPPPPP